MIKNKHLLFILPSVLTSSLAISATCSFDSTKSCQLITDILQDKASNGLNYYASTNYDHRMSGEINVYNTSKVIKKADGKLTLLADLINTGYWLSGEIMTRANLNSPPFNSPIPSEVWTTKATKHGYLEVNINLPVCTKSIDGLCQQGTNPSTYNRGLWPAIWMMPTYDSNWPQNGEIDIMEAYPQNTAFNVTTATLHFNGNAPQCGGWDCRGIGYPLESHQFPQLAYQSPHTWGFEWEADPNSQNGGYILTGYIDNVKTWGPLKTDTLPADGAQALQRGFNDPNGGYYLIVNLAVGGPYAGAPNSKMQAASMQINSVKFYKVNSSAPDACNPPINFAAYYSLDKRNINLKWQAPADSTNVLAYKVKDWQKRVLWQDNKLTWTDTSLPGTSGKFTYYLSSVCSNGVSQDIQYDVIIPDTPQCASPTDIQATYSNDKKAISLGWSSPVLSLPVTSYQVRDWQQRVLWQGNSLNWTDHSLPGTPGKFTYFINAVCSNLNSNMVQKDVFIN
ncbi:glycoside hydrolase family 16 protein [Fluoribacter dumoffii]|uniref:Glucan endo-1,3-beta-glucosidase A1 n=1 Tax=Fluoribacter dumoffii TaxID=463 RepID=A0A377G6I4_9GAMM|nr:glycoside hydrolase family 16 protein [Fluoribacter dumoffii]KTC89323.1 Glucan endo-1,3-beta-glucosidase A1 precursor [Fluoribacter dumoffii NY 23]MCW8386918.1 glycoside hydrolase family 16 protein [Fluoribacter dumoffii]MCW8497120.1 glycoside hydrolase family 16 protein [Fluoribacter dumoffii]STO20432.1 Glucan endo-1,3-beta-glucosidase A1 precursor [Fluoribacter dumoffii]